jgi:adenosine/AMP kinase
LKIDKPDDTNFIMGQTQFIKWAEDLHEALVVESLDRIFRASLATGSPVRSVKLGQRDVKLQTGYRCR